MSAREWKSGDVAMLTYKSAEHGDGEHIAMYAGPDCRLCFTGMSSQRGHWHAGSGMLNDSESYKARPLVVIDAEDWREVERLYGLFSDTADENPIDGMQAALREFANPKPTKPEEPIGLGAVVEDAGGTKWISHDSVPIHRRWLNTDDCGTRYRAYDELDVVKVLSAGVTP